MTVCLLERRYVHMSTCVREKQYVCEHEWDTEGMHVREMGVFVFVCEREVGGQWEMDRECFCVWDRVSREPVWERDASVCVGEIVMGCVY